MASERERAEAEGARLIPLAEIDLGDQRHRITTCSDSNDLQSSIRRWGLLRPALVSAIESGFIIVSGFRRIDACRALGWSSIPARVIRQQSSDYACALLAVAENSLERPLNLIETSRALHLLARHTLGGRIPEEDLAALRLPTHRNLTSRLRLLCRMPTDIQEGVLEGTLSFAMASELGGLEEGLGTVLARLFRRLKPSLNKQREIVTLVAEIARREGADPIKVLEECGLERAVSPADPDRNQEMNRIRRLLRKRRFPALAAAEDNFMALRQRLKLGQALQLAPPRDFEGTCFTLTLSFETREELVRLRNKLDELIEHSDFKTLMTGKGRGFEATLGS
jgi:ParB family chromosome partitioning protein